MDDIVYKHLPPHYGGEGHIEWVPFLNGGKILFSSAEYLNDCFECRVQNLATKVYWGKSAKGSEQELLQQIGKLMLSDKLKADNFILSMNSAYHSSSMWARYARDHTGVCIGFKSSHRFFRGCNDKQVRISPLKPVKYRTEPPRVKHTKLDEVLFTKSLEWAFEEESRMIFTSKLYLSSHAKHDLPVPWEVLKNRDAERALQDRDRLRPVLHKLRHGVLVCIPSDAIAEVIVGFEADKRLKDFLRGKATELNVPLRYAMPSLTSFRIEKVDRDPRP